MNIQTNFSAFSNRVSNAARSTTACVSRVFAKIAEIAKEIFKRIAFFFQTIPVNQRINFQPMNNNEYTQNLLPACITAATCRQDDASWTTPLGAQSLDLSAFAAQLPPGFTYLPHLKTIVHKDCAIVIKVYETDQKRFICFGSKSAILHTGLDDVEKISKGILAKGIQGALGINAPFFDPTIAIADFLTTQTPLFNDAKETQFIGHSYGGSLAEISAIHTGKKAISFAPFHLGIDIQYKLGSQKLADAMNNVKVIFVENDWLMSKPANLLLKICAFLRIRFPNNFGNHFRMPSAYKSSQASHDYLLGSYMHNLGYSNRTKPCDLDPAILNQFR